MFVRSFTMFNSWFTIFFYIFYHCHGTAWFFSILNLFHLNRLTLKCLRHSATLRIFWNGGVNKYYYYFGEICGVEFFKYVIRHQSFPLLLTLFFAKFEDSFRFHRGCAIIILVRQHLLFVNCTLYCPFLHISIAIDSVIFFEWNKYNILNGT